jgi:cyclic pyranopterin phosphate synthase
VLDGSPTLPVVAGDLAIDGAAQSGPDGQPSGLVDGFGRVHTNLRIAITDRCNFRCVYCMPEEMVFYPREHLLTFEEILRLAKLFVALGVDKIRLTGGEPTLRRDLPLLVRGLSALPGLRDLSLTTNGVRLKQLARPLYEAGLRRINVSLDSLDPVKFRELARRDMLPEVLAGLDEADKVGFRPIKLNAVALRDYTESELLDFARLARDRGFVVRFIEFMPLDGDDGWDRGRVLDSEEILRHISPVYPLEAVQARGPEPAQRYRFVDGRGEIGMIPTISNPFCRNCNRVRLTADGKLRYCLFALEETDLKTPMREGASDAELEQMIRRTVANKWEGHLINQAGFSRPGRNMSQIGG